MQELEDYANRVMEFFRQADIDQTGSLSWDEFKSLLRDPKCRAIYQTLDLDVTQAHMLFDLLDRDGSRVITTEEFTQGCMHFKGQATSIDLNIVLAISKQLID